LTCSEIVISSEEENDNLSAEDYLTLKCARN